LRTKPEDWSGTVSILSSEIDTLRAAAHRVYFYNTYPIKADVFPTIEKRLKKRYSWPLGVTSLIITACSLADINTIYKREGEPSE
jgi:hypothetical protein